MSDLQNQTPADTYKGLLQVGDYTNGVDSNAKYISDGEGTPSALSISESKIGVGTASPQASLHISDGTPAIRLTDTTPTTDTVSQVWADTDNVGGLLLAADITDVGTDPFISARIGGTGVASEKMRIDSDGNCGIGTAIPAEKLSVIGDILIDNGTDSTLYLGKGAEGVDGVTKIKSVQTGTDSDELGMAFFIHGSASGSTPPSEAMRIDFKGRVGINTTSPSAPLEVASTTGGVIIPRMTTTDRIAISSPTDGEMIYNTTTNKFQGRANGAWVDFH
jgi:hypothetical protein